MNPTREFMRFTPTSLTGIFEACQAHVASPRFKKHAATTQPMILSRKLIETVPVHLGEEPMIAASATLPSTCTERSAMKTKWAVLAVMAATAIFTMSAPALRAQSPATQDKAPAYYVAELEVIDREGLRPYAEQVESTFAPFSGRYIVRGGQMDRMEGDPPTNRMVIIAFDSVEQARAWYNSPEYSEIRPIRHRSGHTNAYIIEGLPN